MTADSPPPASGRQIDLRSGTHHAVVTEVGGGLRRYDVDGRPVVAGYPADEPATAGRGQVLIPWPNRLPGGRWRWEGEDLQLPLDELPAGNALHGLTRWLPWSATDVTSTACRMTCRLHPRPGWPGTLDCTVQYSLDDAGLTVTTTVVNAGSRPCPVAVGMHPYLATVDDEPVDSALLRLPAATVRSPGQHDDADLDERPDLDFRVERRIGEQAVDATYRALQREEGSTDVVFRSRGRTTVLWLSSEYRWLQLYTGDDDPVPGRRRRGLAVEPMTAPPAALATGEDLRILRPHERLVASWGVGLRGVPAA